MPFCFGCARPGQKQNLVGGGRQRALWAIGGFLVPPRGCGAQRLSPGLGGLGLQMGSQAFPFPLGLPPASLTPGSPLFIKQSLSYTKIHSFASVAPSILAVGFGFTSPAPLLHGK